MTTCIVGILLLLLVGLAVRSLVRQRRSGGCPGGCSGCPSAGQCAGAAQPKKPLESSK